jgi:hypothetical protein
VKPLEKIIVEAQRIALAINELPLTVSVKTELGGAIDALCWAADSMNQAPTDAVLSAPLREHLDKLMKLRAGEGALPSPITPPLTFMDRSQPPERD